MGQRHQLFVIAKIGNRYRGLAVFHHQWLYGALALRQCLEILAIFSAPVNRLPIRQELTAAKRYDETFWTKPCRYDDNDVPFPFITTCLLLGASFDMKDGYNRTLTMEPFNMAFDQGDNMDGITVIDITDLSHVRYCFVLLADFYLFQRDPDEEPEDEEPEDEEPVNDLQMTPLSGPIYLGVYKNMEAHRKRSELESLMQKYDHWDLIEVDALANTWPQGKWLGAHAEG